MTWLVFGRTAYDDPLTEQGSVDDGSAEEARERFHGDWVELVLVPAAAAHWVVRAGRAVGA